MAKLDLELTDAEVAEYAQAAHEMKMSLNEFFNRAVSVYIIRELLEENKKLRKKLKRRGLEDG